VFNPFHGAQYAVFLYHVGRVLWERDPGNRLVADRVYGLNRALHGVDMFYEVEMPPVFACDHPLGSIIGRARIGSCFFFTQHCTVGNNKGIYPVIGNHVTMLPGSTILGNCAIGDHVVMAAQSYVRDRDIPAHSLVFGQERNIVIKPITPGSEVQYWLAGGDE
jgi:serine O-acetyltransferase